MTPPRIILAITVFLFAAVLSLPAQEQPILQIETPEGSRYVDLNTGLTIATNVFIQYNGAVLTADRVTANEKTGEITADGNVRIQQDEQVWIGDHIRYNFKTRQMATEEFRTGKYPVFAAGRGLQGDITNHTYSASRAFITTDDISRPFVKIRARHIRVIPGERIEATHATLCFGSVPVFYFPYYARNLGERANNLNFLPGYRSAYGPFLLSNYRWYWNDYLDGELHMDYRQKRGPGAGPDFNFDFGRWGEGQLRYYYTHDEQAGTNGAITAPVSENRQRLYFAYQATPATNLDLKSLVRYQSDMGVLHDFFEGEYRQDPQPNTFVEVNKFWQNFSLDTLAEPRINPFFETVERLPDVRLIGFRQEIGDTPFYYESESSAGYYRRAFAEGALAPGLFYPGPKPVPPDPALAPPQNYEASRADTFHQITLPETFFGWLNVTPRAGGRFTHYGETTGPGGTNDEASRGVFNTGAEVSFKASRLWPAARSRILEVDGIRHIIEPSVNYVYVPRPNYVPNQLPQFDYELPSLRPLPIEFPEYNSIDSIDSQNVVRFGLHNKLQTKREGRIDNLLNWDMLLDWRLRPRSDQRTFADLYSDLSFKPRAWITLESETRFDPNQGGLRMSLHTLTFEPNDVWSWSIGHFYLKDDFSGSPTAWGEGNNLITSSLYYRLNENWGFRTTQHFDARHGRMQEQYYTVYRDMRSWTAALTAGLRDNGYGPKDFTIAFTFSVKAMPRFGLGRDTVRPYSLLGE